MHPLDIFTWQCVHSVLRPWQALPTGNWDGEGVCTVIGMNTDAIMMVVRLLLRTKPTDLDTLIIILLRNSCPVSSKPYIGKWALDKHQYSLTYKYVYIYIYCAEFSVMRFRNDLRLIPQLKVLNAPWISIPYWLGLDVRDISTSTR